MFFLSIFFFVICLFLLSWNIISRELAFVFYINLEVTLETDWVSISRLDWSFHFNLVHIYLFLYLSFLFHFCHLSLCVITEHLLCTLGQRSQCSMRSLLTNLLPQRWQWIWLSLQTNQDENIIYISRNNNADMTMRIL